MSTDVPTLHWLEPVTQPNRSAYQLAAGTEYSIRKTFQKDGKPMYWAWHARKLLGYSTDPTAAREFCEERNRRESACP